MTVDHRIKQLLLWAKSLRSLSADESLGFCEHLFFSFFPTTLLWDRSVLPSLSVPVDFLWLCILVSVRVEKLTLKNSAGPHYSTTATARALVPLASKMENMRVSSSSPSSMGNKMCARESDAHQRVLSQFYSESVCLFLHAIAKGRNRTRASITSSSSSSSSSPSTSSTNKTWRENSLKGFGGDDIFDANVIRLIVPFVSHYFLLGISSFALTEQCCSFFFFSLFFDAAPIANYHLD